MCAVLPPGFGLSNTVNADGTVGICAPGSFREGWVAATSESSPGCVKCADSAPAGAMSTVPTEQVNVFNTSDDAVFTPMFVAGSASSCGKS